MAGVEIGTLRLRGSPHLASRAAFRIEDGLRTELADSGRLILIRRMKPGRRSVSARPEERSGAIRTAYEAATRDARHARDAGDGAFVNCVWFESPAEARRLLLAELLAGRRPAAWFWRLAVPEWEDRPAETWLPEIAERALGGGGADEREAVALLLFALEQSGVDAVAGAVRAWAAASCSRTPAPPGRERGEVPAFEQVSAAQGEERAPLLREAAAELRSALPAPVRERIESLVRKVGPAGAPMLRLLERLLLQASPSLALDPLTLRKIASAWSGLIAEPTKAAPSPCQPASLPPAPLEEAIEARVPAPFASPGSASLENESATAPRSPQPAGQPARHLARSSPATAGTPLDRLGGCMSDAAGLWLVIPSLIRLGFREWLCERPFLLRQDSGRTLLRTLARHHRVAEEDPVLTPFEALDPLGETPEWARLWRSGLDGWLQRRTLVPLHRLIRKRGLVSVAGDSLVVRFPLEAADIRLRRRALDVDPGWVDWLGLSVRFRYEEKVG